MIDMQDLGEMFLYKRKDLEKADENSGVTCRYMFVKRIINFPVELIRGVNPKSIFSPSLMRHLDYNPISSEFIIKDIRFDHDN